MEKSVVIKTGERLLSGELARCGECTDGEKGRMQEAHTCILSFAKR